MSLSIGAFQPSLFGGLSFPSLSGGLSGLSGNLGLPADLAGLTGGLSGLGGAFAMPTMGGSDPMAMLTSMLLMSTLFKSTSKSSSAAASVAETLQQLTGAEPKKAAAAQPSGKDINPDGEFDVPMRDVVKVLFKAMDYDKGITPMTGYKPQMTTILGEYIKKVGADSYEGKMAAIATKLYTSKAYTFQGPGAFITGVASLDENIERLTNRDLNIAVNGFKAEPGLNLAKPDGRMQKKVAPYLAAGMKQFNEIGKEVRAALAKEV